MLKGFTREELERELDELKSKTHKGVKALYQAAADGGIIHWSDMLSCLQSLADRYEHEYPDYCDDGQWDRSDAHDSVEDIKGAMEKARDIESGGCSLQEHAKLILEMYPIAEKIMHQWVNKDGKACDEYGRPLSYDGEHSVFEIIRGGKFKKKD